jgi:predicted anti-sigma-YlaC factor YlaD
MTQHLTNEKLIDYMHGALTPQEDAAVYAHMETCGLCRAEYDAETTLSEMLREQARRDERELPPTLKAEIWQRIREAEPTTASRLFGWFRPVFVPIAAAIALAAYFGTSLIAPHGAPMIEAAYYLQDHAALNNTIPFSDHGTATPVNLETAAITNQQTAVNVEAATYTADANR